MSELSASREWFDPEMVGTIRRAIRLALESWEAQHRCRSPVERIGIQAALDRAVMELVRAGELDENRLRDGALAIVGRGFQTRPAAPSSSYSVSRPQ